MKSPWIAPLIALALLLTTANPARAEQPYDYLMNGDLVVSRVGDTNAFLAYSKHTGVWRRHTFGEGVKPIPVLSNSLCVFMQSGDGITELVGIDRQGNWRTAKLHSPASECKPIVGESVAFFLHDGRAYAFSPITGTWDSFRATGTPIVDSEMVLIKSGDSIAVFSAQTGRWAVAPAASDAP